jgi:hypothetical protein
MVVARGRGGGGRRRRARARVAERDADGDEAEEGDADQASTGMPSRSLRSARREGLVEFGHRGGELVSSD